MRPVYHSPPRHTTLSIEAVSASAIKALSALDTKAVPSQVVVAARRADKTSRRVSLQPTLTLSAIPDAILGTQHPAPPLAIKDRQVAHRDAKGSGLQRPDAAFLDQVSITQLGFGERIDSHAESIAPTSGLKPDAPLPARRGGRLRSRSGRSRVGTAVHARTLGKVYPL
jgi:hypothetical protein